MYQSKREDQYKNSAKFAKYGMAGMILIIVLLRVFQ